MYARGVCAIKHSSFSCDLEFGKIGSTIEHNYMSYIFTELSIIRYLRCSNNSQLKAPLPTDKETSEPYEVPQFKF